MRSDKEVNPPEVEAMKRACGIQVHSAAETAQCLLSGLKKGRYHLPTPDFLQSISQSTMSSLSPHPYWTPLQMLVSCFSVPVKYYITTMFDRIVRETVHSEARNMWGAFIAVEKQATYFWCSRRVLYAACWTWGTCLFSISWPGS